MFLTLHLVWQNMDDRAVRLLIYTKCSCRRMEDWKSQGWGGEMRVNTGARPLEGDNKFKLNVLTICNL